MVLPGDNLELDLSFSLHIDAFNYRVFAITDSMKCLACGKTGHLVWSFPTEKDKRNSEKTLNHTIDNNEPPANTPDGHTGTVSVSADSAEKVPAGGKLST